MPERIVKRYAKRLRFANFFIDRKQLGHLTFDAYRLERVRGHKTMYARTGAARTSRFQVIAFLEYLI